MGGHANYDNVRDDITKTVTAESCYEKTKYDNTHDTITNNNKKKRHRHK